MRGEKQEASHQQIRWIFMRDAEDNMTRRQGLGYHRGGGRIDTVHQVAQTTNTPLRGTGTLQTPITHLKRG